MLDEGGFEYSPKTERFNVNFAKIEEAVKSCVKLIMEIQATGNREKALQVKKNLGINRDVTLKALEKLKSISVDIAPLPFHF